MAEPSSWTELPVPRARYGAGPLLAYLGWATLYYAVNHATEGRSVLQPLLPFEAALPRVSALYPLYAVVYVQAFLPLWLAPTRGRFLRVAIAFLLASAVAFAIFLLAPMEYPRPPLHARTLFDQLLAWEYGSDPPRNTFPSLHVACSVTLWLGLRDRSRGWSALLLLNAASVSLATVLLKQHFLVDAPAGALLAWLCWRASARLLSHWTRTPRAS